MLENESRDHVPSPRPMEIRTVEFHHSLSGGSETIYCNFIH